MTTNEEEIERRAHRRVIYLDPRSIAEMIDLPAGAYIHGIRTEQDPVTIVVTVVDPDFAPVPENACAPMIASTAVVDPSTRRVRVSYDYAAEKVSRG